MNGSGPLLNSLSTKLGEDHQFRRELEQELEQGYDWLGVPSLEGGAIAGG